MKLSKKYRYQFYLKQKGKLRNIPLLVKKRPLTSFFIALAFLFLLILLGSFLFGPKGSVTKTYQTIKEVTVFNIGESPTSAFPGQVEKSGVINIIAQSSGIIQTINVSEGTWVGKDANLIQLSSNYQGANAPATQTAIASKQLGLATENLNRQKEIIDKQREIANKQRDNTQELRQISSDSVSETQSLVDTNQQILDTLNSDLQDLIDANTNDVNHAAILQTREAISQFQAGLNQAKTSLRNLQYQTDTTQPPAVLADLQKDITLKQLDLQEKTLQLNKDIAQLQVSMAFINQSLLHPTAPFSGIIDRVFVTVGQLVSPGTPLLELSGDKQTAKVIVKLPGDIAKKVSLLEPSVIHLNSNLVSLLPFFVSREGTDNQLYSVVYNLPDDVLNIVTDKQFLSVDIPIGYPDTYQSFPFIPLDSVFQTQSEAFVYLVKGNKAVSQKVELGTVLGKFVAVLSGLSPKDQVILDRNVLAQDKVKIKDISQ